MSAFYSVEVVEIDNVFLRLKLRIINRDKRDFIEEENVAFQLILEPIFSDCDFTSPLGKNVSLDRLGDEIWIVENADKYIASVQLEVKGDQQAEMLIEVTDPQWIAHLQKGMNWESSVYDME
jgi:hypothetical protein